jgi:uncharacterized protein YceK
MNKITSILVFTLLMSGCASIISGSDKTINITSTPVKSEYLIKQKSGKIIKQGVTPDTVVLKTGDGYFKSADYDIDFNSQDYISKTYPLNGKLNMWYFGNIIWPVTGVLIGMGIVDPWTGAMWTLPDQVDVTLQPKTN